MSLVLNVEILGEFKKLTAATQGASKDLNTLSGTASKISSSMTKAFAAIGIGLSLGAITRELENATKAAIDDRKSQALLANAMVNTTGATNDQVTAAEKAINRLQWQAGVADDKLRPAYQKLFLATKDVTKSNDLLKIALDASAGTGKDLDAVSQAMAKSLAGSDTALLKLIPSLKGSKTPLEDLGKAFAGASEKAANLDPYQKLQVLIGDMEEQIGMALLPTLDKFSQWLSTPEGQEKIQAIVDGVTGMLTKFGELVGFLFDNKEAVIGFAGGITAITLAVKALDTITSLKAKGINASFVSMFGWVGLAATALQLIVDINKTLGLSTNKDAAATWATTPTGGATNFSGNSSIFGKPNTGSFTNMAPIIQQNTTVNIKGSQSAAEIAATLNKQAKATGSTSLNSNLLRLLR